MPVIEFSDFISAMHQNPSMDNYTNNILSPEMADQRSRVELLEDGWSGENYTSGQEDGSPDGRPGRGDKTARAGSDRVAACHDD
ncbi:hypothetical protein RRG08_052684 [Elysia crispata]|uniref:Uncharacterized protein n=1 Tax=Elysia crispata TaxID=231223 RepID=A0AAE1E9M4_9GAST|nr:hypothetical protein RRG08_052684 [Elysia crispata]